VTAAGLDVMVMRSSTPEPDSGGAVPVSSAEPWKVPSESGGTSPARKMPLPAFRARMLVACELELLTRLAIVRPVAYERSYA
jgi:hypothetical protein